MHVQLLTPHKALILLSGLLIFAACQPNSVTEEFVEQSREYPLADELLWPHYQSFEEEAALRGFNIDLNLLEVTGFISPIPEQGVAGTCTYGTHINEVNIDQTFWNRSGNLTREYVVFHELGHCVLHRDHTEGSDNDGICISLMNSGTTDCRVAYNTANRDYYIDELFDGVE